MTGEGRGCGCWLADLAARSSCVLCSLNMCPFRPNPYHLPDVGSFSDNISE